MTPLTAASSMDGTGEYQELEFEMAEGDSEGHPDFLRLQECLNCLNKAGEGRRGEGDARSDTVYLCAGGMVGWSGLDGWRGEGWRTMTHPERVTEESEPSSSAVTPNGA